LGQIRSADEHPTVREQAVKALSELEGEPVVAALQNGLGDEEPWIRSEVVGALGNIGGEQAVISLGQVLFGEPEPEIRSLAIDYLATQPGEAARHFLEAALEDPDVLVRQAAESALIGSQ
jgi:HEAT repeat protein